MTAAGGAGIGKASAELLQELQKAQKSMDSAQGAGTANFDQAMQAQQSQQVDQASNIQQVQATPEAHNILMTAKTGMVDPSIGVRRVEGTSDAGLKNMVKNLVDGQNKMEKIMDLALSGRQFSPQEMLIMQAGVMRYSQEVELTGKVVDKATAGIKQTMNTQV